MPQINIDKSIDAKFLAGLAGLGTAWGFDRTDETTQVFAFQTNKMNEVELALLAYPHMYLNHVKSEKLEKIAEIRREKELKGPNGITLDNQTILRMLAAVRYLERNPSKEFYNWEVTRGVFAELPRDLLFSMSDSGTEIVVACFDNVKTLTDEVLAITLLSDDLEGLALALAEVRAIDITSGWPVA